MTEPAIKIEASGDILKVGGFPDTVLGCEKMLAMEKMFLSALRPAINTVEFDYSGITKGSFQAITFYTACAESCRIHHKNIRFLNIGDNDLLAVLDKLGYDGKGVYHSPEKRVQKPSSIFITAGAAAIKFYRDLIKIVNFTGEVFLDFIYLVLHPWKVSRKEVLYYMDKGGTDAIPIVTMICFLVGLILAFQGLGQMARFGLQIYIVDLVGLAIVRELGPLMVAMICIGRSGSSFAAELGTMKVAEELDAMNTMGLSPARFLVLPKIAALVMVMPMLVVIGDFAGIGGGLFLTSIMSDITVSEFYNRLITAVIPQNALESLVKGFLFAFIIAGVGCFRGMEAESDAKGVGVATTSSVVTGIFLVIIADAAITIIFPQIMRLCGVVYL